MQSAEIKWKMLDLELGQPGEHIPVRPLVLCRHYHAEEALALVHFGREDGG